MMHKFDMERDFETVKAWAEHVGESFTPIQVPRNGLIDKNAAAFLFETDSGLGIIELLYANPSSKIRDFYRSSRAIVLGLLEIARQNGLKRIISFTKRGSIGKALEELGYKKAPGTWMLYQTGV